MARVYIAPPGLFPGGIAGGYGEDEHSRRGQTLWLPVGTRAYDVAGNEYTMVKAGATIALNDACRLNAGLLDVRPTSADNQQVVGIANTAFTSGDYGWLLTRGTAVVKMIAATAINVPLASGGTAGTLKLNVAADIGTRPIVSSIAEAAGTGTAIIL